MFSKQNLLFLLMTVTAATATSATLTFMLSVYMSAEAPTIKTTLTAVSTLLFPLGSAVWVSPDFKTTVEGICVGMLVGLAFAVSSLYTSDAPGIEEVRAYFILHAHILDYLFIVFGLVIASSLGGFGFTLGLLFTRKIWEEMRSLRK